jgi:hypothetical protein
MVHFLYPLLLLPDMVFVKALGFFDLLVAVMLILGQTHIVHGRILIACAAYLMIKGVMFFRDIASKIDICVGIYCVILIFHPLTVLTVLASAYLAIKGFFSFAA